MQGEQEGSLGSSGEAADAARGVISNDATHDVKEEQERICVLKAQFGRCALEDSLFEVETCY